MYVAKVGDKFANLDLTLCLLWSSVSRRQVDKWFKLQFCDALLLRSVLFQSPIQRVEAIMFGV